MNLRYLHQIGIGVDQLANSVLGGWADETLSARMYRNARLDESQGRRGIWWHAERITNAAFVWQDWLVKRRGEWTGARHCERAHNNERDRMHSHPSTRPNNG